MTKTLFAGLLILAAGNTLLHAQSAPSAAVPGEERQPGFDQMQQARAAFESLVRAYERGDVLAFERELDADMIGRGRFIDALQRDANAMRNLRVHLSDLQLSAGRDVAVVNVRWEKRFLGATDLQPGLQTGRSVILMHRDDGGWRMASVSGDNLFGGPAGARGSVTVQPSPIALASLPLTPAVYGPFVVEVSDADLVGRTTLSVEVTTPQGEREVLSLIAVGPGRFRNTPTTFHRPSAPTILPGNNVIEIFAATTLSVRYLDQTPGSNRPPLTLTRRVVVQ